MMMEDNDRRARLIADVIKHLENLDGDDLQSQMQKPDDMGMPPGKDMNGMAVMVEKDPMDKGMDMPDDKGPMDKALEMAGDKQPMNDEDEPDDDEMEELKKMSS